MTDSVKYYLWFLCHQIYNLCMSSVNKCVNKYNKYPGLFYCIEVRYNY